MLKEKNDMKNKKKSGNDSEKWVLLNKQRKVIFASDNIAEVVEEGQKYKIGEASIEKKLIPGTCFF
jgi:hypothetical protein